MPICREKKQSETKQKKKRVKVFPREQISLNCLKFFFVVPFSLSLLAFNYLWFIVHGQMHLHLLLQLEVFFTLFECCCSSELPYFFFFAISLPLILNTCVGLCKNTRKKRYQKNLMHVFDYFLFLLFPIDTTFRSWISVQMQWHRDSQWFCAIKNIFDFQILTKRRNENKINLEIGRVTW